jgi:hypothetical protein
VAGQHEISLIARSVPLVMMAAAGAPERFDPPVAEGYTTSQSEQM